MDHKSETPNLSFKYPKLRLWRCVGLFNLSLGRFGFCDPRLFKSWDYLNPTNPRTNPWNFLEKILKIGGPGKWGFLSRPFYLFFFKKKRKICFISMKTSSLFICGGEYFIRPNMHTTVRHVQWVSILLWAETKEKRPKISLVLSWYQQIPTFPLNWESNLTS